MRYRIIIDYGGYEGMKFWDDKEYDTVDEAVHVAQENGYGSKFYIVNVINWEAVQKCPYPDYPKVKYKECPVHGSLPHTPEVE